MILNSPTISGSLTVTGNIIASGSITLSGSVASASYAASASNALAAQTASFVALAQSASNAVSAATASSADNLLVRNTLTAQTLVVQTITSSVDFVTGSTRFGSLLDNTHVFSGSVTMNPGGLFVSSSGNVGLGVTPSVWTLGKAIEFANIGNAVWGVNATQFNVLQNAYYNAGYYYASSNAASYYQQASGVHTWYTAPSGTANAALTFTASMTILNNGNVGIGTVSPSNKLMISNNGNAVIAFRINDTNANASFLSFNASNTDSAIIAGGTSAIPFDIYTGGVARMRITSGGDMEIQGTNSSAKVSLFRNYSNNQPGISVYNTSNSEILYFNGNNSELGIAGGVSYGQSLKPTAAVNSGYYTIDSAATYISLGANGAVNIGGFSGMVLVTNTANGVTMLFLCGGGGATLVSQSIGGAAGSMSNWLGSGYTFTTAYGSTANYSFQIFRTRTIA